MSDSLTPQQRWRMRNPEKVRGYARSSRERRRAANPHASRDEYRKYREQHPIEYMMANARQRAKSKGVPFTITSKDLEMPTHCPVFPDIELKFAEGKERPGYIPTIDRIVPEHGYVPGNVRVISLRANRLKSDATLEELERLLAYVKESLT